jgi:hypothetical protein
VPTKICSKCKRELPLDAYYFCRNKRRKDGWDNYCKECSGSHFGDRNIKWTTEEIEILTKSYGNVSNKELSEVYLQKRSITEISNKARKLGLLKNKEYMDRVKHDVALKNLKTIQIKTGENNPRWSKKIDVCCDNCNSII